MLVGYNTNVPYKGKVYHVQTEDNGIKNPVIVTLLYFKGTILSSKKISYAHFASSPDYKEQVRELMKEQHKNMIRELVRGKHTGGEAPGGERIPEETKETPADAEVPLTSPPKAQISRSLDDVLLEFILRKRT